MDLMNKIISLLSESYKISSQLEKSNQGCELSSTILASLDKARDLLVLMESCG